MAQVRGRESRSARSPAGSPPGRGHGRPGKDSTGWNCRGRHGHAGVEPPEATTAARSSPHRRERAVADHSVFRRHRPRDEGRQGARRGARGHGGDRVLRRHRPGPGPASGVPGAAPRRVRRAPAGRPGRPRPPARGTMRAARQRRGGQHLSEQGRHDTMEPGPAPVRQDRIWLAEPTLDPSWERSTASPWPVRRQSRRDTLRPTHPLYPRTGR